jgi:hypothetical protein
MEQYLKKLVEDAINSSRKQKNSTGSKTPRPLLPIQTNKGRKNKTPQNHLRINKKRKPCPESDSDTTDSRYIAPPPKKNSLQPYKHKNKQEAIITPRKHRHPNNGKLKSNATETYSLQPNKRTKQQTSKQKNTSQNETPTWEKKTIKKFPWEYSRPSRRKEERRKKREEKQR